MKLKSGSFVNHTLWVGSWALVDGSFAVSRILSAQIWLKVPDGSCSYTRRGKELFFDNNPLQF